MSVGSSRRRVSGLFSAVLTLVRHGFAAGGTEISLDQEDLLYADGFASGERGEAWAPFDLDAERRQIWTEGYRDGRSGGTGTRRKATRRLPAAALA